MIELAAIYNFIGLSIVFMYICVFIVSAVDWITKGGKLLDSLVSDVDRRCDVDFETTQTTD